MSEANKIKKDDLIGAKVIDVMELIDDSAEILLSIRLEKNGKQYEITGEDCKPFLKVSSH